MPFLLKPADSWRLLSTVARLLNIPSSMENRVPEIPLFTATADPIAEDMTLPATARIRAFQMWSEQGTLSLLENGTSQLAAQHPEYATFPSFLLVRAKEMDMQGIAAFCAHACEERERQTIVAP